MTETPEIHGTTAPGFEPVRDAFAANWQTGNEIGAVNRFNTFKVDPKFG